MLWAYVKIVIFKKVRAQNILCDISHKLILGKYFSNKFIFLVFQKNKIFRLRFFSESMYLKVYKNNFGFFRIQNFFEFRKNMIFFKMFRLLKTKFENFSKENSSKNLFVKNITQNVLYTNFLEN